MAIKFTNLINHWGDLPHKNASAELYEYRCIVDLFSVKIKNGITQND
jgi:hypothetical protein